MSSARVLGHSLIAAALAGTALVAVGGSAVAADPADQALARLDGDAKGALTVRGDGSGDVVFVGVPAKSEVDNPAVRASTSAAAAADAHVARYGAAFGTAKSGATLVRSDVQETVAGDVVRYRQRVDGVPVLGGEVVVSMGSDHELSSILAETTDVTRVRQATVSEADAAASARAAFERSAGTEGEAQVDSLGRWVFDPALVDTGPGVGARTVWRFEVTRDADERREVMVDDRTGVVLMNVDLIAHVDRVVCDDNNVRRSTDVPCTSGFARTEGGAVSGVTDVNTAYDLSGVVSDFYQQVGGVDLTSLLGISIGGVKRLASTVRWCYTDVDTSCPYDNAFWNGAQMYYGTGFAVADDVVGHEITHGFTEHSSGLFYWGQSGAMNESISDIIGEIIDHRHPSASDSATNWEVGEDIPGYPNGFRDMQDPTVNNDPDKTSSPYYVQQSGSYSDNDGVHWNSGVGNKTFYLISQGGTFNGQSITGIDSGDPGLTKSAKLWLLVDQSLTSGSDYADEAAVLDQSCQALLARGTDGFTPADCTAVHQGTVATELRSTPVNNAQPADAEATCPAGTVLRTLFDSETGNPASKFVAGSTWSRDGVPGWGQVAHSGPDAWASSAPAGAQASALVTANAIALPAGQASYLIFDHWRMLEWGPGVYEGGTVEVDDTGDASGPIDVAPEPWVNGPTQTISGGSNPANGRLGFGGDSRGYIASRLDLTSFAGHTVKPRFTMNLNSVNAYIGWFVDEITVYTCDFPVVNSTLPTVSGTARVGVPLAAAPGTWTPTTGVAFAFQWLRNAGPIAGATSATYTPTATDRGATIAIRVTGTRSGYVPGTVVSAPTAAVAAGTLVKGKPSIQGKAQIGSTLAAKSGTWKPSGVSVKFQWLRNGKPIRKAAKAKYKLVAGDKGKKISVRVTGTKAGYVMAASTSKATGKVKAKPKKRR